MSYIYKLLPDGIQPGTDPEQLLRAVREVEVVGDPTDLIALSFKPDSTNAISTSEIARREDWRDLPRSERASLYISEGKQVDLQVST